MTGNRIDFVTGAPEKYAHLVDAVATGPERLRDLVSGRSASELRRDPGDGNWFAARILAHLVVVTQRNATFLYQMSTMTDPVRQPFDEAAESERLQHANPESLVQAFEAAVGEVVAVLSHTPDAAWGRPGRKNGLRRSLRQEVESMRDHFDEHLSEVGRLLGV